MIRRVPASIMSLCSLSALGLVAACGGATFTSSGSGAGGAGDTGGALARGGANGVPSGSGGVDEAGGSAAAGDGGDNGAAGASAGTGASAGKGGGKGGGSNGGMGGGSSGGATGGSSGTVGSAGGPACPDADSDGQTTCAGDCDDSDPSVFKGNPEICGDAKDNDCNTKVDDTCSGLGTFVSADVGSANNPGTQKLPVQTIAQGMANATKIGGGVAVYVAGAHYPEKVTLIEGMSLFGGYDCNNQSCTWARDPLANDTAILATDNLGVVIPNSVTRATKIDGFRIMGLDGAGQGRGRTALTINGGTAVVSNNRIFGPASQGNGGSAQGRSLAVLIQAPSNAKQGVLLDSNQITGGAASDASIAVLLENANGASTPVYADIRNNTIRGGTSGALGAGLVAYSAGAGSSLSHNDIWSGTANAAGGSAWAVMVADHLDVDGNLINVGNVGAKCTAASVRTCGGLYSMSATMTITNNVVFGVAAPVSTAVDLAEAEKPGGAIVLNSNLLDGGGSPASGTLTQSAALTVEIGACSACGFNGKVGKVRNNILRGGVAGNRFGVFESAPAGKKQHPDALENNVFFLSGVLSPTEALYRYFDGTNQTLITTAAAINQLATSVPAMTVGANQAGDPKIDVAFHLLGGSMCIDAGTATEAPSMDRDAGPRPLGKSCDVGPDEAK